MEIVFFHMGNPFIHHRRLNLDVLDRHGTHFQKILCQYDKIRNGVNLVAYRPTGSVKTGWAPGTVPPTTAKRAVSMENVSRD